MSDVVHRLFSGREWREVHTVDGLRYRMTIQVTPEYKAKLDAALSHAAGQEAVLSVEVVRDAVVEVLLENSDMEIDAPVLCDLIMARVRASVPSINPAEIDRKLVGGEAVAWIIKTGHGTGLHEGSRPPVEDVGWRPLVYGDTPAQPPASAEVGRDADEVICEHSGCGRGPQANQVPVTLWPGDKVLMRRGRLGAAMAASSGRKGDEMP